MLPWDESLRTKMPNPTRYALPSDTVHKKKIPQPINAQSKKRASEPIVMSQSFINGDVATVCASASTRAAHGSAERGRAVAPSGKLLVPPYQEGRKPSRSPHLRKVHSKHSKDLAHRKEATQSSEQRKEAQSSERILSPDAEPWIAAPDPMSQIRIPYSDSTELKMPFSEAAQRLPCSDSLELRLGSDSLGQRLPCSDSLELWLGSDSLGQRLPCSDSLDQLLPGSDPLDRIPSPDGASPNRRMRSPDQTPDCRAVSPNPLSPIRRTRSPGEASPRFRMTSPNPGSPKHHHPSPRALSLTPRNGSPKKDRKRRISYGFTKVLNNMDERLEAATKLLDMMSEEKEPVLPPLKPLGWSGDIVTRNENTERNSVVCVREGRSKKSIRESDGSLTIKRSVEIAPDYNTLQEKSGWQRAVGRLTSTNKAAECLYVSSRDMTECSGDMKLLREKSGRRPASAQNSPPRHGGAKNRPPSSPPNPSKSSPQEAERRRHSHHHPSKTQERAREVRRSIPAVSQSPPRARMASPEAKKLGGSNSRTQLRPMPLPCH